MFDDPNAQPGILAIPQPQVPQPQMSPMMQAFTSPGMAMAMAAANNFQRAQLGQQLTNPTQIYADMVMSRAMQSQRDQMMEMRQAAERRAQEAHDINVQKSRRELDAEPKRATAEDSQGVLRYIDTGEQVFADDRAQVERERIQGPDGRWRYIDDGSLVLPGIEVQPDLGADFEDESNLRKEFRDETKTFVDQQASMGRIIRSASDPSPAGDLALIFNYMKVLDPGSTVREGEFANAQNAGGVDDRARSLYNQVREGTRLTPEQRRDFVERAYGLYDEAAMSFEESANEYRDLAGSYGLSPEKIITRSRAYTLEDDINPLFPVAEEVQEEPGIIDNAVNFIKDQFTQPTRRYNPVTGRIE